ncbi:MAG: RluA family pseudouridine synthase [Planctomycetes bacterium]|nr:RluA family pseudouridine synthase [Planctomycetota bacterium]
MAKVIKVDYDRLTEHVFNIHKEATLQRLDVYIHKRLPEYSRSLVQKLIREGLVSVNGRESKPGYAISLGDRIVVKVPRLIRPQVVPRELPLEIVHEDDHLIVINKPPDLVVHPAAGHWDDTLVNALLHHCGVLPETDDVYKPGLVHRIDKDTSGVIIAAKTVRAHAEMTRQFQERAVDKEYLAIVEGELPFDEDVIEKDIERHPKVFERMAVVKNGTGKASLSFYRVRERFRGYTFVLVAPRTGRTHQIRVHLGSIGHPCVADATYGRGKAVYLKDVAGEGVSDARVPDPDQPVLARQALHAFSISFVHPGLGEPVRYEAPLAADMSLMVELLRTYRSGTA